MFPKCLIAFLSLLLCSCTIIQTVEPSQIKSKNQLCIIENKKVRNSFLTEMQSAFDARHISYRVVQETDVPLECEWTATYVAHWNWDLAMYMNYAEIKIFYKGSLDGHALYNSRKGGSNIKKFIDAEPKIHELVNQLLQFNSSSLLSRMYG